MALDEEVGVRVYEVETRALFPKCGQFVGMPQLSRVRTVPKWPRRRGFTSAFSSGRDRSAFFWR